MGALIILQTGLGGTISQAALVNFFFFYHRRFELVAVRRRSHRHPGCHHAADVNEEARNAH